LVINNCYYLFMRLLNSLLFVIIFTIIPLLAVEKSVHKKLPLSESLPLLETIKDAAMHLGMGERQVYLFVDPLCPHSQDFMDLISSNEKLLLRNRYNIYLYTLKRLHSEKIVTAIYMSEDPLHSLFDVMIHKQKIKVEVKADEEVLSKIEAIENVAKKLDVYKRPYLILTKKPKLKRGH